MMHLWLLFGLAVFAQDKALQVVEVKSGKNECKNFRSSEVRTHEAMIRCLDMVKLNNARRNSTLDTLRSVISFYVFDDLTRNPKDAYPTLANQRWDLSPVDLDEELQALYTKKFDSERKFHQEVAQVLRKPLDGHLTYTPSCFSNIKFFLPLALQPVYDNGMSVTTIPGTMFGGKLIEYTQNQLGIDLSKYFGARVVAIDGKDPIKALSEMAKVQIGVAKDPSTRLNMMFLSPVVVGGSPNVVWGGFAAPPNTPTNPWVELTFQDKTTIRLPYLTTHKLGFSNAKDFFTSRCLESSYVSAQSDPEDALNINWDSMFQTSLLNTNQGSASDLLGFLPPYSGVRQVTSNSWITTFLLADNKTGVVTYPSNKANTVPELNEFLKTFHAGLQELKETGAEQLIIDVSHNTGGPICASLMLIDYFAGSDAPVYTTNMRANQLSSSLAMKAATSEPGYRVWGPNSWMVDQKSTYSSVTWMVPPSSVTRDSQYFSNPIIDRCPASPIKSSPFPLAKTALVSNGLCLSSCSTLADGLIQAGVKAHSTDGLVDIPPSPHNMQGGQLYTYEKLYKDIVHFNLESHPKAPSGPLPLNALLGFTLREMYVQKPSPLTTPSAISLQDSTTPMEFLSSTANYHHYSPLTTSIRPLDHFWNIVATYF